MAFHTFIILLGLICGIFANCPKNWAEYGNGCYFIASDLKYSYDLAEQVCVNHNGHLMSVNSVGERNFVEKLIAANKANVWFGAREDTANPGTWVWTDGTSPPPNNETIEKWSCDKRPAEPCNEGDAFGPCGVYIVNALNWQNHPCENTKQFICERKNSVVQNCDIANDWHQYNGKCYKELSDPKSWGSANDSCVNNGGRLVVMKEQDQIDALEHLQYCANYEKGIWIGLTDKGTETENTLRWIDNTSPDSGDTNWADGEPPADFPFNHENNCVAAFAIDSFQWRIVNCGDSNRVLCEKEYGVCENGWENKNTGFCYLVVSASGERLTWSDAKLQCKSYGGQAQLMKILYQRDQNALKEMSKNLQDAGIGQVRIGVSDEQSGNVYKWSDNSALTYTSWNDNIKEEVPNRMDCGYILTSDAEARWGTRYCFDTKSYICQIPNYQSPQQDTSMLSYNEDTPIKQNDLGCPENWELYSEACYKFFDNKKKYEEAKAHCGENQAEIITVKNTGEQSFVSNRLRGASWLGLVYKDNKWVWDGTTSQPGFKNWGENGTASQDTMPCSRLMSDPPGQWFNEKCDVNERYIICRQAATPTGTEATTAAPPATPPVSPLCGAGWVYDAAAHACYAMRVDNVNWEEAERRCVEDEEGDLASIPGPEAQTFINAILANTVGGGTNYWIGLNDRDLEQGWKWTDKSPVAYFNWANGEPNNHGGKEYCVALVRSKDNTWNDHNCGTQYDGYICKKDASDGAATTTSIPAVSMVPLDCNEPEAMVSGNMYIQDQYIRARSSKGGREAINARMNSESSWEPTEDSTSQYVEVFFPFTRMVKKVQIAGAPDKNQWVTKFKLAYQTAEGQYWTDVRAGDDSIKVFDGNNADNKNNGVARDLPEMIYAQAIRLYPTQWNNNISMRFDVHGCQWEGGMCHFWDSISGETRVKDSDFITTGAKDDFGKLNSRITSNTGWEANEPFEEGQYVGVKFESFSLKIVEIRTAGRKDADRYVESYKLQLYNPLLERWEMYQEPHGTHKIFTANTNNQDEVVHRLKSEVVASKLRIIPEAFKNGKALRWEVKACPPGCNNIWLVSNEHRIPDNQLKASSSQDANTGPARARLFTEVEGDLKGAWVAEFQDTDQWIEADIEYNVLVKGITIQGQSNGDNWVKTYQVKHSLDRERWNYIAWDIQGENSTTFNCYLDRNSLRTNWFPHAVVARYIRIYPQTWQNKIALRFDIQGCPGPKSYEEVGCYADVVEDRDLPYSFLANPSGGMTTEVCVWHCYTGGYMFAGTQYGSECYCGNNYGSYGQSTQCNMNCNGNPNQRCGGNQANTIHTTGLSPITKRCEDTWIEYGGRCYKFMTKTGDTGFSWNTALYECRNRDADLVSIGSLSQNNFIQSELAKFELHGWIGLHSKSEDWSFEWTDYSAVTYTNWARREPNRASNGEDCVNMYYNSGQWNDDSCSSNIYGAYVCEKGKEEIHPNTSPPPDEGCGEGWIPYRWKCYHAVTQPNNWNKHKSNCQGWGEDAHLARISDNQEQAFLASLLNNKGEMFWTDLNDQETPGTFKFSDGSDPTFTHWGIGQPAITDIASCVAIADGEDGLWYDVACGEQHEAICEKLSTTVTQGPTQAPSQPSGSCDPTWIAYDNYCYLHKDEKASYQLNWDDARAYCNNMGAELVSFHNKDENDYFWKLYVQDTDEAVWLGLSRSANNESFKWSDGSEVAFVNWDDDEPGTGTNSNCARMKYEIGKWGTSSCTDNRRSWMCKIGRGIPVTVPNTTPYPTAGPDGSCAPDNDNWKFKNDKCYFVSSNAKTWYDAESFCQGHGGHLTSVHDDEIMRFLEGLVREQVGSWLTWVGLNEIEGTESWSDTTPVDYVNWGPNEPNDNGGTEMCVGMGSNYEHHGDWIHDHCSTNFRFICAKSKGGVSASPVPPTPMPGGCPPEYVAYRNKCFKFVDNEKLTWEQARNKCYTENKPYSLASISDRFEQAFITSQLITMTGTFWIGLTMDGNNFVWTDQSQVSYTNWNVNEPSGGKDEQCTVMYIDHISGGKWIDRDCENTRRYICMTYKSTEFEEKKLPFCPEYGAHEEDYIKYNDDCYKGATNKRTWQEAEDHCKEDNNGHLTSILSIYEQGFIESVFLDHKDDVQIDTPAWIGLSDREEMGRYMWSDKQTVVYTAWGGNQPNYDGTACVQFKFEDGGWYDIDCETMKIAICKISEKPPIYTRAPSGECPGSERGRDWLEYGSNCYMFIDEAMNFADARHDCQTVDAELASIHNAEDNAFIAAHIQMPSFTSMWWIGLFRSQSSGFKWTDDSAVQYTKWDEGRPSDNGTNGENCAEMLLTGFWNDINCDVKNGYVCKVQRVGQTASSTVQATFPTEHPPSVSPTGTVLSTRGSTTLPGGGPDPSPEPTTRPTVAAPPQDKEPLAPGAVVGIVFGVVALLLLAIVIALVAFRRYQWKQYAENGGLTNPVFLDDGSTNTATVDYVESVDSSA